MAVAESQVYPDPAFHARKAAVALLLNCLVDAPPMPSAAVDRCRLANRSSPP